MTSFPLMLSSLACCFPKCSVLSLDLRPPPAPPPETRSPPTPPEPPDPPDPPDPQISHSLGKANAQPFILLHLTGPPQRAHCDFELPSPMPSRPVPPCRMSIPLTITALAPRQSSHCRRRHHMLNIPCSSNVNLGFYCLGQKWVDWLLGLKWVAGLFGKKLRVFYLSAMGSTPSPLFPLNRAVSCLIPMIHRKPFQLIVTRLLFSLAVSKIVCSFSGFVTTPPISFPQVCSCSSHSDSSTLEGYWMVVESVALALWNLDISLTHSMIMDTLRSKFMPSGGTLIALVRTFTAVCSPFPAVCSPFTAVCSSFPGFILDIGNIKIGLLPLWHIGLTLLMSIHPVNLVGFSSVEYVPKGFVPFIRMGIYGLVDVAWEVQSLFRAEPPHFGTRRQVLFPKFPLVWSGLDDQASPVLKGSSSRLMAFSALVAEFVTLWVALDAVTLEAFGIVLFRSPLVFVVELYFQSISILPYCSVLSCFSCIVILYFTFVMVVIPPHLSEVET